MVESVFVEEARPDPNDPRDVEYTNFCPEGEEKNLSTWEDRAGDPRIKVGDHVRLCYHRKLPEHRTNSFSKEQEHVVGRIAKMVADHGNRRESRLGYIEVKVDSLTCWWRRRDVVLQKREDYVGNGRSGWRWVDIDASRDLITGRVPQVDPQIQEELNQNTRRHDWERTLEPAISNLCREALVDLCMAITKDAIKPGMDEVGKRALFERTEDAKLIDGLKSRHYRFRNILDDFNAWQKQRMEDIVTGKVKLTGPLPASRHFTNIDYDSLEYRTIAAMARDEGADLSQLTRDQLLELMNSIRPPKLRKWYDKPSYVNTPADKSPESWRQFQLSGRLSDTTLCASHGLDLEKELIKRDMSRGLKSAYEEGLEYAKLRELAAHPVGMEMEKLAADRVRNTMRENSSRVRDQMLKQIEHYRQQVPMGTRIPPEMLSDRKRTPNKVAKLGVMYENSVKEIQAIEDAELLKHCEKAVEQIKEADRLRRDLEATKPKLAARGFPTEPLPEPKCLAIVNVAGVGKITSKNCLTDGDLAACSDTKGHWEASKRVQEWELEDMDKARLEQKKEQIAKLQAEIDAMEKMPPTVGTPTSLNDWLRKPMGSF